MSDNPYGDWPTFETKFQQGPFVRSKGEHAINLYCLSRSNVVVWFLDGLDERVKRDLSAAFFPDEDADRHYEACKGLWPWKLNRGAAKPAFLRTPQEEDIPAANRQIVHAASRVVLPYNHYDNCPQSKAFGTDANAALFNRIQTDYSWPMWKTASRSCVMRIEPLPKNTSWEKRLMVPSRPWPFRRIQGKCDCTPSVPDTDPYRTSNADPLDYSIKTGVTHVGREDQSNTKQNIDANWIVSCMRSDYLQFMKTLKHGNQETALVFLPEVLIVAGDRADAENHERDGVMIRSLRPLDPECMYFPPLSIPFVGCGADGLAIFESKVDEFHAIDDQRWNVLWKGAWVRAFARSKALLLLRYGLQSINPHVQNYLIEFRKDPHAAWQPTGRIVVRDLQDTALHREVIWALFGRQKDGKHVGPPQEAKDFAGNLFLEVLDYEFSDAMKESRQETGKVIGSAGYKTKDTQFGWQEFGAFASGKERYKKLVERIIKEQPNLHLEQFTEKLLGLMAEWGVAHNLEYVHTVESALGHSFRIDWATVPDPARWNGLFAKDQDADAKSEPLTRERTLSITTLKRVLAQLAETDDNLSKYRDAGKIAGISNKELLQQMRCLTPALQERQAESVKIALAEVARIDALIDDAKRRAIGPGLTGDYDWELENIKPIHEYLGTMEGQNRIRRYRDRGWPDRIIQATVTIVVQTAIAARPMEHYPVRIRCTNGDEWTDMTDETGKVYLYGGKPSDYSIVVDSMLPNQLPRKLNNAVEELTV